MNVTKPKAAAVGVAVAATIATGLGVVASVETSAATAPTHTLRFNAIQLKTHSTGATTFIEAEVERHNGNVVGYDVVTGKFDPATSTARFRVAVARKGGLLFARVKTEADNTFHGTVTGGRGKFQGAMGTVTGHSVSSSKSAVTVRYHL